MRARQRAAARDDPRRVSNVVFMGMGEPMANYDNTWATVERLHGDMGISARHLTISTVGIVPGIRRLADEQLPVNLAVSLHAADDELRDELVPINKRYPLAMLAEACEHYLKVKNRRLSFEWALIDGVNDRGRDATELADYARALRAHVNLIPLNPTPGYLTRGSTPERVRAFRDLLRVARRQRHRAPEPRHRHRRRVRPAAGRPRGHARWRSAASTLTVRPGARIGADEHLAGGHLGPGPHDAPVDASRPRPRPAPTTESTTSAPAPTARVRRPRSTRRPPATASRLARR